MDTGKLYSISDNQFVANVNYRLEDDSATSWWGELILTEYVQIGDSERYIIELEDKRKGRCYLKKMVNRAVSGVPPRYTYRFSGLSLLE